MVDGELPVILRRSRQIWFVPLLQVFTLHRNEVFPDTNCSEQWIAPHKVETLTVSPGTPADIRQASSRDDSPARARENAEIGSYW